MAWLPQQMCFFLGFSVGCMLFLNVIEHNLISKLLQKVQYNMLADWQMFICFIILQKCRHTHIFRNLFVTKRGNLIIANFFVDLF